MLWIFLKKSGAIRMYLDAFACSRMSFYDVQMWAFLFCILLEELATDVSGQIFFRCANLLPARPFFPVAGGGLRRAQPPSSQRQIGPYGGGPGRLGPPGKNNKMVCLLTSVAKSSRRIQNRNAHMVRSSVISHSYIIFRNEWMNGQSRACGPWDYQRKHTD